MTRWRVEIQATCLGWVEDIEAASAEEAGEIARNTYGSSDFDAWDDVQVVGTEEQDDAE